jgi:hypothetical protein
MPAEQTERILPWVCGDEDGEGYSAEGHVDPVTFTFAVIFDLAENVGDAEAFDILDYKQNGYRENLAASLAEFVTGVNHVWMRPDPDHEDAWLGCEPTDEGALPWTTVTL